jgi:DNA-binding ferritin-like protein (Dps family)
MMECWKWQRRHFRLEEYDDPFKALYDLVWKIDAADHNSMYVKMTVLDILEGLNASVNDDYLKREGKTQGQVTN